MDMHGNRPAGDLTDRPSGERRHHQALSWGVTAVVFLLIVVFLVSEKDLAATFRRMNPVVLLWLFLVQCMFNVVSGLVLKETARFVGVRLSVKEWFGLPAVTTMGNYLTPASGGLMARAVYLHRRHGLSYPQFLGILSSGYLVNYLVIAVTGILVVLAGHAAHPQAWPLTLFFLTVIGCIVFLLHRPAPLPAKGGRVCRFLRDVSDGWPRIRHHRGLLGKLFALSGINVILGGLSLWISYRAIGNPVSGMDALLVALLQSFSLLFTVTPANLGVQEAVVGLASGILGLGLAAGLMAALLVRTATVVFIVIFGPLFSYLLTRELNRSGERKRGNTP